jgi:hypothetical protein
VLHEVVIDGDDLMVILQGHRGPPIVRASPTCDRQYYKYTYI